MRGLWLNLGDILIYMQCFSMHKISVATWDVLMQSPRGISMLLNQLYVSSWNCTELREVSWRCSRAEDLVWPTTSWEETFLGPQTETVDWRLPTSFAKFRPLWSHSTFFPNYLRSHRGRWTTWRRASLGATDFSDESESTESVVVTKPSFCCLELLS